MTSKRRDICALRLLEIVTHQNVESPCDWEFIFSI